MAYQPVTGDVALKAVGSDGLGTLTTGYITSSGTGAFMPVAPTLSAGLNPSGNPQALNLDGAGNLLVTGAVSQAPLPASGVSSVTGTLLSAGATSPVFTPQAGRPFNVSGYVGGATGLNASLGGTLYLQKSVDGGVTFLPTTAGGTTFPTFSSVFSEPLLETVVGTQYQFVCSSYSGTAAINVRFSQ